MIDVVINTYYTMTSLHNRSECTHIGTIFHTFGDNNSKNPLNVCSPFDLKGCICRFTKRHIHPFLSKGTIYSDKYGEHVPFHWSFCQHCLPFTFSKGNTLNIMYLLNWHIIYPVLTVLFYLVYCCGLQYPGGVF